MACKYKYKNKWYSELEIKNQILRDISLNDIIVELSTQMSYTVEINTAKDSNKLVDWENNPNTTYFEFTVDDIKYTDSTYGYYYKRLPNTPKGVEISEEEYNKAKIKSSKNLEAKPTQYYSNLTVPGGTNYTEQEISTPLITPSIKGHAQFSTDNGIGWFRSDDKAEKSGVENKGYWNPNTEEVEYDNEMWAEGSTKTRRILEVQSDLFQKGRDRKYLIGNMENTIEELGPYTPKAMTNSNSFLQLLNKDNNWVTFFVKAIIQSTAKETTQEIDKNDVENMIRQLEKEGKLKIDCN